MLKKTKWKKIKIWNISKGRNNNKIIEKIINSFKDSNKKIIVDHIDIDKKWFFKI